MALAQITHGNACIDNLRAVGQAGNFNRGARRSISKLEPARILGVHDAHRHSRC